MQSNVIWNNCMISLYGILSVLGASVSHINDLYNINKMPLPVLKKHAKITNEQLPPAFFSYSFPFNNSYSGLLGYWLKYEED